MNRLLEVPVDRQRNYVTTTLIIENSVIKLKVSEC